MTKFIPSSCETVVTGTVQVSGLTIGGRVTEVTIDNLTWTALPATALAQRNALRIQNYSGQEVKTNYDYTGPLPAGYVGMVIPNNGEAFFEITDNVVLYAKSSTSSCVINVEEVA